MDTVLVGYDGSATARQAVAKAAQLTAGLGGVLHIVTVVDDAVARQGLTTASEAAEARAQAEALNRAAIDDADLLDGQQATGHVLTGTPASRIVACAEEFDADIIVVGNRRVQGVSRILGSVAVDVLRHAPCCVFVAHTA